MDKKPDFKVSQTANNDNNCDTTSYLTTLQQMNI